MKSLLSLCFLAGSALVAGSAFTGSHNRTAPGSDVFFTCAVNGEEFTSVSSRTNDSSLTAAFTYADNKRLSPAALFINAEESNGTSYLYIQPINDDAPAAPLTAGNNLYDKFFITYKTADNSFYNTTTAPGNLEITAIDTANKILTGKLNCILYSSAKKDWLLITNGRFRLKF